MEETNKENEILLHSDLITQEINNSETNKIVNSIGDYKDDNINNFLGEIPDDPKLSARRINTESHNSYTEKEKNILNKSKLDNNLNSSNLNVDNEISQVHEIFDKIENLISGSSSKILKTNQNLNKFITDKNKYPNKNRSQIKVGSNGNNKNNLQGSSFAKAKRFSTSLISRFNIHNKNDNNIEMEIDDINNHKSKVIDNKVNNLKDKPSHKNLIPPKDFDKTLSRFNNYIKAREEKLEEQRKIKEEKEVQYLQDKPYIYNDNNPGSNNQEFLKRMEQFEKEHNRKIKELQDKKKKEEEEEEKYTENAFLSHYKNKKLPSGYLENKVNELYKWNDSRNKKIEHLRVKNESEIEKVCTFKPELKIGKTNYKKYITNTSNNQKSNTEEEYSILKQREIPFETQNNYKNHNPNMENYNTRSLKYKNAFDRLYYEDLAYRQQQKEYLMEINLPRFTPYIKQINQNIFSNPAIRVDPNERIKINNNKKKRPLSYINTPDYNRNNQHYEIQKVNVINIVKNKMSDKVNNDMISLLKENMNEDINLNHTSNNLFSDRFGKEECDRINKKSIMDEKVNKTGEKQAISNHTSSILIQNNYKIQDADKKILDYNENEKTNKSLIDKDKYSQDESNQDKLESVQEETSEVYLSTVELNK